MRNRRDLVEEDAPLVRNLEESFLGAHRAGESALHVAEEIALEEIGRKASGVHRHEGLRLASAVVVDGPRHELFAGAALAGDEHRRLRGRHLLNERVDLLHPRRLSHQDVEALPVVERFFQRAVLVDESALLHAVRNDHPHFVVLEGLGDVVEGTALHRFDRRLHGGEGGDHDHHQLGIRSLESIEHVDAGTIGKHHVHDRDVDRLPARDLEPVLSRARELHPVAFLSEERLQYLPHHLFVIDDENGSLVRHSGFPSSLGPRRRPNRA